ATINGHHMLWLDVFFRNATFLADGWVPTVLALLLLFFKDLRSFMMMGVSCAGSAIIVQTLKHTVFDDCDRPGMFAEELGKMDWVQGIEMLHYNSFPSGHSTAAFSMCLALVVVLCRKHWVLPLFALAVLLGFSRIWLSQHFTEDVLAGSTLGTLTAFAVHHWLYESRFAQKRWLGKRLLPR
ncbi:MAG TPA: phosphatase PAP2 family protein, partial [Flavobacteriales bacterium]|nr:phosphatase PAP2 family protein [Flavobacteriales bacterium]